MLLKAVETGYVDQACHLVSKGADVKKKNKDGFTALDFIFARKIEKLKKAVFGKFGEEEFKLIDTQYDEERLKGLENLLCSTRDVDSASGNEYLELQTKPKTTAKDTEEEKQFCGDDNTHICSDFIKSIDSSKGDFIDNKLMAKAAKKRELREKEISALGDKIKSIKQRMETVTKSIQKLQKKRRKLSKLRKKKLSKPRCPVTSNREFDFAKKDLMNTVCLILTNEMLFYINFIKNFQKKNMSFFEKTYQRLSNFISANFDQDMKTVKGGSFNCGLIMPWSNLNINVIVRNRFHHDNKKKSINVKGLYSFFKILKADKKLVKSISLEETSSLAVIKLELSNKFRNLNVEIIFKNSVKRSYPENETIIKEYLEAYPISKFLYVIFRTFLHYQGLDDPGNGGLNSVSIFLLVIGYLQKLEHQFITNAGEQEKQGLKEFRSFIENPLNNGQIFVNFLFFYSYSFDFYRDCIKAFPISAPRGLSISKKNPKNQVFALTILNPYNEEIILTKSFRRTIDLKEAFKLCYISMFSLCGCLDDKVIKISPIMRLEKSKNQINNQKSKGMMDYNPIKVKYSYKIKRINPKTSLVVQAPELDSLLDTMKSRNSFFVQSKEENQEEIEPVEQKREYIDKDMIKKKIQKKPCFVINRFFNFKYDSILTYD